MNDNFSKNNRSSTKRKITLLLSKYSRLIIIIILLTLFLLSYFFVLNPKYNKMKKSTELLINARMEETAKMDTYLERLKNFNRAYNNISIVQKEKINKMIPSINNYEDLIVEIDDIVKNRNLVLRSINIDKDVKVTGAGKKKLILKQVEKTDTSLDNVREINLSVSISGIDYMSMKELLSDFEKNLRLMDIENIEYNNGDNVLLDIKAYYFNL